MRRHHDMGGVLDGAGPVLRDEHEHDPEAWEKKVDAILRLLVGAGVMTVDELRRGIEEIGPGAYDELGYYQRWITSVSAILLEKGVVTPREIGVAMAAAQARHAGRP